MDEHTTTLDPRDEVPLELRDDTGDLHYVPAACQRACPVGTDAPSYIGLIWEGRLEEAFEAITATNPFSSSCARICAAPCETACRRAESDGPIGIRNLKRFVMDRLGTTVHLPPVEVSRGQTIGIVGGGPAGLTAAQDLALAGHEVHLYEISEQLGGMIAWGIPHYCLPPQVLKEDIDRILERCPGIEVHLNCALGDQVTLDQLKERHHAVLLAIGATWGKNMGIPGEDSTTVMDGVGFLHQANAGAKPEVSGKVVVIGGGDVAIDVARTAVRLGAAEVHMSTLENRDSMPAHDREIELALEEGIDIHNDRLPTAVDRHGDSVVMRCVKTTGGGLDAEGRLQFEIVEGSEYNVPCDIIIAAVGQKAECDELEARGMVDRGRVVADFETMRTDDPQVFAAGDGAFGGSTIVTAMHHGHKAAYYIKAYLEGRQDPIPYRTPYRTRRIAVAQDIEWSKIAPNKQQYLGLGDDPAAFEACEAGYDPETALAEAARCFRCDAETGSADYSVRNREDIVAMSRTSPDDAEKHRVLLQRRLEPRPILLDPERPASFDDLVFLPANLSRLVIDPYREACSTETILAGGIRMDQPFLATGFDDAPGEIREGLAGGLEATGCGYVGARPMGDKVPWLQVIGGGGGGGGEPDPAAAAVIHVLGDRFRKIEAKPAADGQLLGLAVSLPALAETIPYALDEGFDLLLLDASGGFGTPWPELSGTPELMILRDAIRILRDLNREEDIDLLYFGGVRSGTDAAKALSLGSMAAIVGVAMGLALGGIIDGGSLGFGGDRTPEELSLAAENLLKSMADETSIMARCTGKTNVHNLEPEDLKSISLVTSESVAIPLVGRN